VLHLDEQLALVTKRLHRITSDVAPKLVATKGIGPEVASTLLMTAGDNPPSCDDRTRDYLARRQAEGKSKTEAIRCLKRYVAREVFNAMPSATQI